MSGKFKDDDVSLELAELDEGSSIKSPDNKGNKYGTMDLDELNKLYKDKLLVPPSEKGFTAYWKNMDFTYVKIAFILALFAVALGMLVSQSEPDDEDHHFAAISAQKPLISCTFPLILCLYAHLI